MKKNIIHIHKPIITIPFLVSGLVKISLILFFSIFIRCTVINNDVIKHNYFNKDYFYNDSLKVAIDFSNSVEFLNTEKSNKLNINLKNRYKYLSKSQILLAFQSKNDNYKIHLYFDSIKKPKDNLDHQKIILEDTIHKISIFEKYKGTTKVIVFVESFENNDSKYSTTIGNDLLSKITIGGYDKNKLSNISIFNNYSAENSLQARHKLLNEPTEKIKFKGLKWQLLATVNSFMSNNKSYDTLILSYEKNRKEKYNVLIKDTSKYPDIYLNKNVFEEIGKIAKENKVLILNEDHYYPKHRIFGMELLEILKINGYKYISLEAFDIDKEITFIPNKKNGDYIYEPYFAHFIRNAKKLDFVILGHENYNDELDRELGQAINILKNFEKDPDAKIFVYVGHSHIEEMNEKKKWMAQYLKELSGIDPVTINQVTVCADTKQELILMPRTYFKGNFETKSSADYFLINNIKPSLKKIYPKGVFKNIKIESNRFNEYKNQEILVEIIDFNEFNLIKKSAIPLENVVVTPKGKVINLELPVGKYHIFVKSDDNNTIYDGDIIVN